MEPNSPVKATKLSHIVRAALFMLRKGVSKSKLLLADLNMTMKLGKLSLKAMQNLMFHHSHHWATSVTATVSSRRSHDHENNNNHLSFTPQPDEYEFSCSNSPVSSNFHLPFHLNKRKKNQTPPPPAAVEDGEDEIITVNAVMKAFNASPALPGFGKSPMVRQLRVTDSPYPLVNVEEDSYVDEAAENFIKKFYKDLRRQNAAWENDNDYKSR